MRREWGLEGVRVGGLGWGGVRMGRGGGEEKVWMGEGGGGWGLLREHGEGGGEGEECKWVTVTGKEERDEVAILHNLWYVGAGAYAGCAYCTHTGEYCHILQKIFIPEIAVSWKRMTPFGVTRRTFLIKKTILSHQN